MSPDECIEKTVDNAAPEDLFARLSAIGIAYSLHHHAPMFRVQDGLEIEKNIPGSHCRNLFLRDRKERMVLVTALNETALDLKKLAPLLEMDRISFGSPDRLMRHLGVIPGSVCPFAIMNDAERKVRIVLDSEMMRRERVNYHPLRNTMTLGLTPNDLLRFFASLDREPEILDLSPAAPDQEP